MVASSKSLVRIILEFPNPVPMYPKTIERFVEMGFRSKGLSFFL